MDVAGSRLLDASSLEPIPTVSSVPANTKSQLYTAFLSTTKEFQDLLAEYPDLVSSKGFSASTPKHPVRHTVLTVPVPPVFTKARRLDAENFSLLEKSLLQWKLLE